MAAKLVQGGLISPPSACLTAMAAKLREQRSGLLAAAAAHGATRLARVTTAFSTRPGWHDWGVGIAYAVAQRADCTRRRVGAVVFDEANRILSTGYNGAPAGRLGCLEGGCPRGSLGHDELPLDAPYEDPSSPGFCISIHAESNALLFADREFPDPSGGIDRHVEPLAQFSNLALRSRTVVASGLSEDDVLCDGERFNQPKVLVNHADSGRDGVFG